MLSDEENFVSRKFIDSSLGCIKGGPIVQRSCVGVPLGENHRLRRSGGLWIGPLRERDRQQSGFGSQLIRAELTESDSQLGNLTPSLESD